MTESRRAQTNFEHPIPWAISTVFHRGHTRLVGRHLHQVFNWKCFVCLAPERAFYFVGYVTSMFSFCSALNEVFHGSLSESSSVV